MCELLIAKIAPDVASKKKGGGIPQNPLKRIQSQEPEHPNQQNDKQVKFTQPPNFLLPV